MHVDFLTWGEYLLKKRLDSYGDVPDLPTSHGVETKEKFESRPRWGANKIKGLRQLSAALFFRL